MQGRAVQFGWLVQTPARTSNTKNYIYPPAGGAVTQANSFFAHTVCCTFNGHAHFCLESFFSQNRKYWKNYFFKLPMGFCPICMKLGTYTLQMILSYQKNFARSKHAQIINEHISVASYKNVNCMLSRSN